MARATTTRRRPTVEPDQGSIAAIVLQILAAVDLEVGVKTLYPGDSAVWDFCDCDGQLSLVVASVTPYGPAACPQAWDVGLVFSVVRCVATSDDNGNPPPPEVLVSDELQILADTQELSRQILALDETVPAVMRVMLGTWAPLGPMGGCAGGAWSATVSIPVC